MLKNRLKPDNFGSNLIAYIKSIDMTQKDLSCRTGITRSGLNQMIKGKRRPDLDSLCKILNSLNVTFEFIMNFNEGDSYENFN